MQKKGEKFPKSLKKNQSSNSSKIISIDMSSQMQSDNHYPKQGKLMKLKNSFLELDPSLNPNQLISLKENARACLMIMNTSEYFENLEFMEDNDLYHFTKANVFDIFQNEMEQKQRV